MHRVGRVYLIGAGCGDWELITLKGLRRLQACDCVVYDRLISSKLLEFVPKGCKRVYVGKQCGHHSKTQDEINRIIVEEALSGKTVARLKGGDVFVFGRGGEEVQALQEHNIPYEVVSGVSSSIAVPSSVGIPVTHRNVARSFHVVTGHTADNSPVEDFSALARLQGTLIFLMSLGNLESICEKLVANGKDANTPCAIVSKGTTKDEKVYKGTLSNIADFKPHVAPPTIFIVGETVNFNFKSTIEYPLQGVSIAVTGTDSFTSKLEDRLSTLGGNVTRLNHIQLNPQLGNLPTDFTPYTHIVFTSTNGVNVFFEYLKHHRIDLRNVLDKKFATVGRSTADSLAQYGIYADIVPQKYTSSELANAIVEQSHTGDHYLILRAYNGSNVLTDILQANHIQYEDVKTYTLSCNVEALTTTPIDGVDYIVFGSSMGVKEFFKRRELPPNVEAICIGEVCKSTLDSLHLKNTSHVAKDYTVDGIVDRLLELHSK